MDIISVFDGHNDTLTKLYDRNDFSFHCNDLRHIDLVRAKKGGFVGGFFAIYTPPCSPEEREHHFGLKIYANGYEQHPNPVDALYAKEYTKKVFAFSHDLEKRYEQQVQIIKTFPQLQATKESGKISMVLHMEGAEAVNEDLSDLAWYYENGLRSLGIVWSRSNVFGHGVPFSYPRSPDTGKGLTEAGKKLVSACNEMGIILDLAHINEKGFWDVAAISKYPLVVSHTAVHALCPSSRNLTDKQIDAVGKSGGVMGIIFESANLNTQSAFPDKKLPIFEIVKHIDYVVQKIGEDHVVLGSDFDGADLIEELQDVSMLPSLIRTLKTIGYTQGRIEKIAYKNWQRVIKDTWQD